MTDPYIYPDTDVLINRLDIRDYHLLEKYERQITTQRIDELLPQIPMAYKGYKALHHHIFQDLYDV